MTSPEEPGLFGVAQADPGKLLDYSTVGVSLAQALVTHAAAVDEALGVLAVASDPHGLVPAAGDVAERFSDLAGDWFHLDEFVGDVGSGFARLADPFWNGDRTQVAPGVVSGFEILVGALGRVGYADRDDAVAAAAADVEAVKAALDDGRLSATDVEELSSRIGRGRHDPAYAVHFVDLMGPEGMVAVVGLIEDAYASPRNPGNPETGWGLGQLAPFGDVLTTALGTLPGTASAELPDVDLATLPDDQRLASSWLDEFVDIGLEGDLRTAFDHSLLVSQAVLPAAALLSLADRHVTPRVRSGFEGPTPVLDERHLGAWGPGAGTIETNIVRGLGNNAVAAEHWLSDEARDGTTNAEALLDLDVGASYQTAYGALAGEYAAGFGDAASDLWGAGLPLADDTLVDTVIDEVAKEGGLHIPGMEPGLAEGVVAHFDVLDQRVNDGFDRLGADAADRLENTSLFLREVMRNDEAAAALRQAAGEYIDDRLDAAPTAGVPREAALQTAGRTVGAIARADANAARAGGRDADAGGGDAADRLDYLIGWLPGLGPLNDLADAGGNGIGGLIFGDSHHDEAADEAQRRLVAHEHAVAGLVAIHHYEAGHVDAEVAARVAWDSAQERKLDIDRAAVEGLFLQPDGTPRTTLPPIDTMTEAQRVAFLSWVFSSDVVDADPGLPPQAASDANALQAGSIQVGNRLAE